MCNNNPCNCKKEIDWSKPIVVLSGKYKSTKINFHKVINGNMHLVEFEGPGTYTYIFSNGGRCVMSGFAGDYRVENISEEPLDSAIVYKSGDGYVRIYSGPQTNCYNMMKRSDALSKGKEMASKGFRLEVISFSKD